MQSVKICCNGNFFKSIYEFATAYSLHPSLVARRLRSGWTPEQAAGLIPRKRSGHGNQVLVNGISYPTIKDACVALNLDPKTIRARIQRGYSVEDAFAGNLNQRTGGAVKAIDFDAIFRSLSFLIASMPLYIILYLNMLSSSISIRN